MQSWLAVGGVSRSPAHGNARWQVGGWCSHRSRDRIPVLAGAKEANALATCDARSHVLSELPDWRSTEM